MDCDVNEACTARMLLADSRHRDAVTGPALTSAGPNWKQFCGVPLSVCTEIFEEHQVIMIEIGDVKDEIRRERPTASLVGSTLAVKLIKQCPVTLVFGENFCSDCRWSSLS